MPPDTKEGNNNLSVQQRQSERIEGQPPPDHPEPQPRLAPSTTMRPPNTTHVTERNRRQFVEKKRAEFPYPADDRKPLERPGTEQKVQKYERKLANIILQGMQRGLV